MKRIFTALLSVCLCFCLFGCSSSKLDGTWKFTNSEVESNNGTEITMDDIFKGSTLKIKGDSIEITGAPNMDDVKGKLTSETHEDGITAYKIEFDGGSSFNIYLAFGEKAEMIKLYMNVGICTYSAYYKK